MVGLHLPGCTFGDLGASACWVGHVSLAGRELHGVFGRVRAFERALMLGHLFPTAEGSAGVWLFYGAIFPNVHVKKGEEGTFCYRAFGSVVAFALG